MGGTCSTHGGTIHEIEVGNPQRKIPVGGPRHILQDNIKIRNCDQFTVLLANTCQFLKFKSS
jgi:hypothetical protein